jgi:hypothetical protein
VNIRLIRVIRVPSFIIGSRPIHSSDQFGSQPTPNHAPGAFEPDSNCSRVLVNRVLICNQPPFSNPQTPPLNSVLWHLGEVGRGPILRDNISVAVYLHEEFFLSVLGGKKAVQEVMCKEY